MNTTTQVFDDLLTFEQVAVALGGSRALVEAAVKGGDLPVLRFGTRCVRIPRDALTAYLARKANMSSSR